MRLRSRQLAKRLDSEQLLKPQSNNDSYWTADGEKGNMEVVRERGRTADDTVIKAELHPRHRGRANVHPSRLPLMTWASKNWQLLSHPVRIWMHTWCRPILRTHVDNYRFVCCWAVKPSSARCRRYICLLTVVMNCCELHILYFYVCIFRISC